MKDLLREYSPIFLGVLISLGIGLIALMFSLKGKIQSLEEIYFLLSIVLLLVLVLTLSGFTFFFLIVLQGIPEFKKKTTSSYLDFTTKELTAMSNHEREKLLIQLKDKRAETQQLIELIKKKFYNRNLSQESFKELIRDHEKELINIESKMGIINKIKEK